MSIDRHLSLVAALHMALAAFNLLLAMFLFVVLSGAGLLSGDPEDFLLSSTVASAIAFFLVLASLPGLLGGIGIVRRRNWGRIVLLVVSVFLVFHMPLGFLLAIYTFWVLFQEETTALFTGGGASSPRGAGGDPG